MSTIRDAWYVRLPNGQEIRAKSTAAVLHHIASGNIPKSSRARRSRDDEWMLLEWHAEFSEALTGVPRKEPSSDRPAPPSEPAKLSAVVSRVDPMRLRTVGVRGLWDDLVAALDSTFVRDKLIVAACAGGLIGLVWGLLQWGLAQYLAAQQITLSDPEIRWSNRFLTLAGTFLGIVIVSWANGLLARITHLELATLRRVRWSRAMRGWFNLALGMTLAYLVILGSAIVIIRLMNGLPLYVHEQLQESQPLADILRTTLSVIGLVVEVALWLLVGLTWLLAPALVAEDSSLGNGLRDWVGVIRDHFNRVVLAEVLTLALGLLIAVPIVGPVHYALENYPNLPLPLCTLAYGLACTGFIAFMAVANVFIYLDVKYEQS